MSGSASFSYVLDWDAAGRRRPRRETITLEHPDPRDRMLAYVRETGRFYELDLLEYIAVRGPRGGVFIDVGANIGNHAVYFGKFLADRVVAVEPSGRAREALQHNLERNRVASFTIVPQGVGARPGRASLVLPDPGAHNLGAARLADRAASGGETVAVTTLDAIARELDAPVRFVKLDVEGMELEVLRGAEELLAGDHPELCVELAEAPLRDEVSAWLGARGYAIRGRFCATPTYYFADPGRHRPRRRPSRLTYRLVKSWRRGAIHRLLQGTRR